MLLRSAMVCHCECYFHCHNGCYIHIQFYYFNFSVSAKLTVKLSRSVDIPESGLFPIIPHCILKSWKFKYIKVHSSTREEVLATHSQHLIVTLITEVMVLPICQLFLCWED